MNVTIPCNTDDDPKNHRLTLSDEHFDTAGFVDLTVEGQTVTVWVPELNQALSPFMLRYHEYMEEIRYEG